MNLLTAEGLSFAYPLETGRLEILENMNLTAERGEFLCILGPSGCGKSTLLKLMAGFLSPREGTVRFLEEEVSGPFRRGQMIFQDPGQLLPWLSVRDNVLFPRCRSRFPGRKVRPERRDAELCDSLLDAAGLGGFARFYPSQLSGGMKQRTALARALFAQPDILFMDEPFVSLDAPSRRELQNLLLTLWKDRGTTVLFVTHDIAEALLLADRLVVFSALHGKPEILTNPLERPRRRQDEGFLREEARLYSLIDPAERTL